jgi:hypothetical protein
MNSLKTLDYHKTKSEVPEKRDVEVHQDFCNFPLIIEQTLSGTITVLGYALKGRAAPRSTNLHSFERSCVRHVIASTLLSPLR